MQIFFFNAKIFHTVPMYNARIWSLQLLPRDATQSAVMPQYDVCLSVCMSVCLSVAFRSHRLEFLENNFTAE